jgi:hypothetical protein
MKCGDFVHEALRPEFTGSGQLASFADRTVAKVENMVRMILTCLWQSAGSQAEGLGIMFNQIVFLCLCLF